MDYELRSHEGIPEVINEKKGHTLASFSRVGHEEGIATQDTPLFTAFFIFLEDGVLNSGTHFGGRAKARVYGAITDGALLS